MWIFVAMIEVCIRLKGGSRWDLLLIIHLCCAFPRAAGQFALTRDKFNGYRFLGHARIAYLTSIFFIGMAGTGLTMIMQRF